MKLKKFILFTAVTTSVFSAVAQTDIPVYLDRNRPMEERVEDAFTITPEELKFCENFYHLFQPSVNHLVDQY